MNQTLVDQIVDAVLYEGYALYPYRPALKNRRRWTFGGLYPRAYSEMQAGTDPCMMQTECVVRGNEHSILNVAVRFLHLIDRQIAELDPARPNMIGAADLRLVDSLQVGDQYYQAWQEAVERNVALGPWRPGDPPVAQLTSWQASQGREPIADAAGQIVGVIIRNQAALAGSVQLSAEQAEGGLCKIRVQVENRTPLDADASTRDDALMRCFASAHVILSVDGAEFVSIMDPPDDARKVTETCVNVGAWPVLIGAAGDRHTMLSGPIILYDYPQVAAASPGDLFDGTEIDEILSLRIQSLTDDEKRQAAALDERVRAMLARTESLDRAQHAGLHGIMRPTPEGAP